MTDKNTKLMGHPAHHTRKTHWGKETLVGHLTTPMMETESGIVTHATLDGMVISHKVNGLPEPIEASEPARIELLPMNEITLL